MNNKSKVNPFKFVNGKMITVHQSKEGSTKIGDLESARKRAVELGQTQNVEKLDKQIASENEKYLNQTNAPKETKEEVKKKEDKKINICHK